MQETQTAAGVGIAPALGRMRKRKPTEAKQREQRWTQRPITAQVRWYTVTFDHRGEGWLVAETGERICLAEGMALDIVQLGEVE